MENPELQNLVINNTEDAFQVELNAKTHIFSIYGRRLPENSFIFFAPIFEWLESYFLLKPTQTTINISLSYIHSGANKALLQLLSELKKSKKNGNTIIVNWNFEEDDEDMEQIGIDFAEMLEMEFNFATFELKN